MRQRWTYYLALWLGNLGFFLVLDFAKIIDDLLSALGWETLLVNIGVVALLTWPLAIGLTGLTLGAERLLGTRWVHAIALFILITINLWSLKVGLAFQLEQIRPEPRFWIACGTLIGAVFGTWVLSRNFKNRSENWQHKSPFLLKGWAALTVGCLSIGLLSSPKPPPSPPSDKPSVILITADSLSARSTTFHGYQRNTTPQLAKLAEESVTLERLHSNFNVTGLALPSLNGYLTAKPPGPTLAESLRDGGYPNRAFFGAWGPQSFSLPGFNHSHLTRRGMKFPLYRAISRMLSEPQLRWLAGLTSHEVSYFNPYSRDYHDDIFWKKLHYPPELSLEAALEYLKEHPKGSFVWVHLWPPHFPYLPSPDTESLFGPGPKSMRAWINSPFDESEDSYVASLRNLYDRSVFEVDSKIGRFIENLKANGNFDSNYIIFSSDHGESFERGYLGHSGWPLIEAITHVPMIIHRPEDTRRIKVETLAQQLDFAPTVLSLLNLPVPREMPGESLVPYFKHPKRLSERYKISISLSASTGEGGQLAVYWKTYKVVFANTDPNSYRLFDLFKDPDATHDIAGQHPEIAKEMMSRLDVAPAGPSR